MVLSRKSCPVPLEQQPLEEYTSLIMSRFFSLPAREISSYFSWLLFLSILFILVGNLIFFPTVFILYLGLQKVIALLITSDVLIIFMVMRLYFSWSYVSKRLLSAIVFYEESGWYDGQIWVKTTDVLIQDRLIAMNVSLPLISRIKVSIVIFLTKIFIETVTFLYFIN